MNRSQVLVCCLSFALAATACTQTPKAADPNTSVPVSNTITSASPVADPTPAANSNTSQPEPTSMDYMREGTAAYVKHDFAASIPMYEKALELEKKDRKLEKNIWLVLVDNLAMAHGMTGDIKGSLDVLEYGVSKEPTYPMFYYNMACGYGENGDEENAIKNLRLASKYKANMISGEKFPDPSTDNSFHKFSDSEKFKKALAELK